MLAVTLLVVVMVVALVVLIVGLLVFAVVVDDVAPFFRFFCEVGCPPSLAWLCSGIHRFKFRV